MRLRTVRLAGFKSFVDPTSIAFPGDLISIVGPNGCGKSNIIDAARWVMGEISAKHLRGSSMADVVFTGSSSRQPVSHASVELVFDNNEGRAGGQFAAYSEISVKREVSLDGHSAYSLNGSRCRRRDVMDLFLGTGLGPRSYAVIEQGMISRVVEAKPDDLRDFLEEAAGISKYKERRKETENRIRHTRENLDRLTDLREELGKRLTHLKRQATMAEKYKVFKAQEHKLSAEFEALRWSELDAETTRQGEQIRTQENRLESALAEQRAVESQIETQREIHSAASQEFNEIYRTVLEAGADIGRSEETIQNFKTRDEQLTHGVSRERQNLATAIAEAEAEAGKLLQLSTQLQDLDPELEELRSQSNSAQEVFQDSERALQAWQQEGESLNQRALEPARIKHAEQARSEQLEENIQRLEERLAVLREDQANSAEDNGAVELASARDALNAAIQELQQAEDNLNNRQSAITDLRQSSHEQADALHDVRDRFQAVRGRKSSLEALQQAALGKDRDAVVAWLERAGLADAPRLAELIQVEEGWEQAVEAVLDTALEAISVDRLEGLDSTLGHLEEGGLTFIGPTSNGRTDSAPEREQLKPLTSLVRGSESLNSLLAGVFLAQDLSQARSLCEMLYPHERLVLRDGVQIGPGWLSIPDRGAAQTGVIRRERELQDLSRDLDQLQAQVTQHNQEAEATREAFLQAEEYLSDAQDQLASAWDVRNSTQGKLSEVSLRIEQARERQRERSESIQDISDRIAAQHQALDTAREQLKSSNVAIEQLTGEREDWESRRRERREQMENARDRWHALRDQAYETGLQVQSMRAQLSSVENGQSRSQVLIKQLEQRIEALAEEQKGIDTPLRAAQAALQEQLTRRRDTEQTLAGARSRVENAEVELKQVQSQRQESESKVSQARETVEQLRLAAQELVVRRTTIEEQLQKLNLKPGPLLEGLEEGASQNDWEQKLQLLEKRINRLGPINLAAIDEFEQQSERKNYLDSQNEDLVEALETLTTAISKIDRETRARFRETYEKVNAGLAGLFPRLFGGGEACLNMTGDDLLSTGISITARPPGKRNTSIQLLSGGEKALTAVALVFAIFELNPAPFCLLDEVDAPLDDANVGRFCELVKEMSQKVQFIIVTHNKITMEIANQLLGVTMHEPGVSRLVAVDIDQAVEMAAA